MSKITLAVYGFLNCLPMVKFHAMGLFVVRLLALCVPLEKVNIVHFNSIEQ